MWLGLGRDPQYLDNQKLQGKLILVGLLIANAFFLHKGIFPFLGRAKPVASWKYKEWTSLAAAVSLSNSIWFLCAFLGIARVWNNTVSLQFVLSIAIVGWLVMFLAVNAVLLLASRNLPAKRPDWIDFIKTRLRDWVALIHQVPHESIQHKPPSAQHHLH